MLLRCLAFLSVIAASAQTPLGSTTGTITDPQGAGVPHAEIVATNTGTSLTFRGRSSDDGT